MFDFLKIQVFPEVNGVVTMNDQPVEGASVKLLYDYNDKKNIMKTVTKKDGGFHFPEKNILTLLKLLPFEIHVHQQIFINYNHVEYTAWSASKHKHGIDTEISKKLNHLNCELTNEEINQFFDSNHRKYITYGLARWTS